MNWVNSMFVQLTRHGDVEKNGDEDDVQENEEAAYNFPRYFQTNIFLVQTDIFVQRIEV